MPHITVVWSLPILAALFSLASAAGAARPVHMRLLVVSASGSEPSLGAIRSTLDHLGTPYDVAVLGKGAPLPVLEEGGTGLYQGVILATGNLGICDPECRSAMSPQDWARLDAYAAGYSVRTVSCYGFPDARYGMKYRDSVFVPLNESRTASFEPAASSVFPDVRTDRGLSISGAFVYSAAMFPAPGETTTPILTMGDAVLGVVHTKADGREYLALTFDQASHLRHSLALNRGLIQWVTRSVYVGSSRAYLSAQVDDLFLPNSLFTTATPECSPAEPKATPTATFITNCPRYRITGADLARLREWQLEWNRQVQTAGLKVALAFNGMGAKPDTDDDLTQAARNSAGDFFWTNHTYSHRNLDCYSVTAEGVCQPSNYEESLDEIRGNAHMASAVGLLFDERSVVTPALSGLSNPHFLEALATEGIRYVVADMSRPEGIPALANTGIPSANDRVLLVPRRPTNVFFNAITPHEEAAGSQTDEYNYYFGPQGTIRVGGPGGPPFFAVKQSYEQIVDRESDAILLAMLRGEIYPFMFHQGNLFAYDGVHSLLADTLEQAVRKFEDLSTAPVISLSEGEIGREMEERAGWFASGARVILNPGQSIVIDSPKDVVVPFTGICADGCVRYGGTDLSRVRVASGTTAVIDQRN